MLAPLNVTNLEVIFYAVFLMHGQNNWKACLSLLLLLLLRETWPIPTIRKNIKATIISLKKKSKTFPAGFPYVCTSGSSTRFTFQVEIRKIERGIAERMPFTIFTILLAFRMKSFWCHISLSVTKLGNATYIDRFLGSSALCLHQFSLWSRRTFFGAVIRI